MSAASRPQVGKLHAQLAALGIHERPEKLRTLSALVYRKVESSNDLTRDEAHATIDLLDNVSRRDDATDYLTELVETAEQRMAATS